MEKYLVALWKLHQEMVNSSHSHHDSFLFIHALIFQILTSLIDVYATWCGPCKMMAPQLDEAAAELGDKVRVAKIDSDEYPEWAGRLQVKGLPTVRI